MTKVSCDHAAGNRHLGSVGVGPCHLDRALIGCVPEKNRKPRREIAAPSIHPADVNPIVPDKLPPSCTTPDTAQEGSESPDSGLPGTRLFGAGPSLTLPLSRSRGGRARRHNKIRGRCPRRVLARPGAGPSCTRYLQYPRGHHHAPPRRARARGRALKPDPPPHPVYAMRGAPLSIGGFRKSVSKERRASVMAITTPMATATSYAMAAAGNEDLVIRFPLVAGRAIRQHRRRQLPPLALSPRGAG